MNERKWIDLETGNSSLSAYEISKESNPSSSTLKQYNEKKTEQFNSGELRKIFSVNFHKRSIGLMIVGKHAWLQEEEQKGDICTALTFQG